jgi:hypothetical protein
MMSLACAAAAAQVATITVSRSHRIAHPAEVMLQQRVL